MNRLLLMCVLMWMGLGVYAQKSITVCGFVEDAATGERLPNATLYETTSGRGTASNEFGFYSITLPKGEYSFRVGYVGYLPAMVPIRLTADTTLNIQLSRAGWLEEVVVKGKRSFVGGTQMGRHDLSLAQIKTMPAILGEADVMKALHALPGVNSGSEGKAGISVRGGSPEQTEVLLDGIPVYNVNHLFGYFSIFNGEALQNVSLYKASIPARYGGRLSSVLDVSMREGNMKRFAGNFTLSPIAATLTLEAPIKKDTASFLVTGRYSWMGLVMKLVDRLQSGGDAVSGLGFYDLNAKLNWKPSSRNRFYFSLYTSRDAATDKWNLDNSHPDKNRNSWSNIGLSLRWNHVAGPRLFTNTQVYYSLFRREDMARMYDYVNEHYDVSRIRSRLEDVTLKSEWEFMISDAHRLSFGGVFAHKQYSPETSYRRVANDAVRYDDASKGGIWSGELYVEDNWTISPHWQANIGLRAAAFYTPHNSYYALEPRLVLTWLIDDRNSIKVSWSRMIQPLHMLTAVTMGAPSELWVPVTDRVEPGRSDLYSLGYYRQLRPDLEFSVEGYYNDLRKVIRYQEGMTYAREAGKSWQDYINTGKGRGYGVEVMLNKTTGALNGWISYAWSRSERNFDKIKQGEWFPFEYDRRHKVNLAMTYTFRDVAERRFRKMLGVNFTYSSGNYTTIGRQYYPSAPLPGLPTTYHYRSGNPPAFNWPAGWEYVPHPNNVQFPAYHHLDVAFHLKNKKAKGDSWTFGVYNIYGRKNPSYYYHDFSTDVKRVSICLFVPCVTWSYTF